MLENIKTSEDLANLYRKIKEIEEIDITKLRFVMYTRKSTKDEKRQAKSIPDQITECKQTAERLNLNITAIVKEKESAKEPNIRPKFRQMLNDIKAGKYDAVLAWHPDRLSRNMMEAGEIIDMLDKNLIKSLKFASFEYTNDASGKMLLGIAFVLSKQYTDKLSKDVSRGIKRGIERGQYLNKGKHGYYKDINQYLRPEEVHFNLLQKAWYLRVEGNSLDYIANYMNEHNYQRRYKGTHKLKKFKFDKRRLSELFRDPFYCGVLVYGKDTVCNLGEVLDDFVPMIDVSVFLKINKLKGEKELFALARKHREDVLADLMRGKIICGHCNEPYTSGITVKYKKDKKGKVISTEHRYYYRCETVKCKMRNESIPPRTYLEFAHDLFSDNLTLIENKKAFDIYVKHAKKAIKYKVRELTDTRYGLYKEEALLKEKIEETKRIIVDHRDDKILVEEFTEDLKKQKEELKTVSDTIQNITDVLKDTEKLIYSYPEFLELIAKIPSRIKKTKNMAALDKLMKNIFSNFVIKNRKVASYELKEPFKQIMKGALDSKVLKSRGYRT
ncbi:MAG: recombinase family protein [Patescibacteria group bacterium]